MVICCLPTVRINFYGVIKYFFTCQLKRCPTQIINTAKEVEPEKKESSSEESSSEEESSSDEKEDEKKKEIVPKVIETSEEKVTRINFSFCFVFVIV